MQRGPVTWRPSPRLAAEMAAGKVSTLLLLGGQSRLQRSGRPAVCRGAGEGRHDDSRRPVPGTRPPKLCQWHVPQAHFLESWGDARSFDGTYSVVQPMIAPLHEGRTWIEILARVLGQQVPQASELVKETAEKHRRSSV